MTRPVRSRDRRRSVRRHGSRGQKFRNIEHDARVTVTVWDETNPYRYVEARGSVEETVTGPEARAHIDACAKRYMGVDDYPNPIETERVILKIAVDRVHKFNV